MTKSKTKPLKRQIEPQFTSASLAVPARSLICEEQELGRFPRSGERDPLFQQSRSQWYVLAVPCKANNFKPPIKSVSIRRPGALRGVRCYVVASAKAFFQQLLEEQDAAQFSHNEENATRPSQFGETGPQP